MRAARLQGQNPDALRRLYAVPPPYVEDMVLATFLGNNNDDPYAQKHARERAPISNGASAAMEVVVFVGLQASGKSTYYRSHFASTHVLVSKDLLRNNRNRVRRQRDLATAALQRGESVVVDNTNPTTADRAPLVALARSFGARAVCYYFESRIDSCRKRNASREGRARVPEVALRSTAKRLEVPLLTEGFDELFYVRIAANGEFVIESWKELNATAPRIVSTASNPGSPADAL